jgi:hypothetical protein
MIIALVNQEDQTITICHKTVEVISIFDVDRIADLLMGKQVYYITAAEEANGDDVVDLIIELSGTKATRKPKPKPQGRSKTGRNVMHATTRGSVILKAADPDKDDDIIFDGPLRFVNMPGDIDKYYEMYPDLEKYIKMGYIQVIDSSDEDAVRAKYTAALKKTQRRPQKSEKNSARQLIDKARNKGFVSDNEDDDDDEDADEDDPTRIDITDDGGDSSSDGTIIDDDQKQILRDLGKM